MLTYYNALKKSYKSIIIGVIGGYIGTLVHLPLPWLLGALLLNLVVSFTSYKITFDAIKNSNSKLKIMVMNLDLDKDFNSLCDQSIKKFKKVDILINNAGINKDALSIRMSSEQWNKVIQLNLTAAFKLSQMAIKSMIKQKWGRIVGISSIIGVGGNAGQVNYAASKAGMIGMHKSLALEVVSRGITVNCIAPGFIESPMTQALSKEQKDSMLKKIPVGKVGTPDDVARCVAFLTSEKASFITGSTININGGMLMV